MLPPPHSYSTHFRITFFTVGADDIVVNKPNFAWSDIWLGPGGIARPFSTQIISVNRDVKQISVGFKKVTVEASEMTVGYMTV